MIPDYRATTIFCLQNILSEKNTFSTLYKIQRFMFKIYGLNVAENRGYSRGCDGWIINKDDNHRPVLMILQDVSMK